MPKGSAKIKAKAMPKQLQEELLAKKRREDPFAEERAKAAAEKEMVMRERALAEARASGATLVPNAVRGSVALSPPRSRAAASAPGTASVPEATEKEEVPEGTLGATAKSSPFPESIPRPKFSPRPAVVNEEEAKPEVVVVEESQEDFENVRDGFESIKHNV